MNNEEQLIERYRRDMPAYQAMGQFVQETIIHSIESEKPDIELFIKIPAKWRLKDESSLLGKAFSRGKNYADPYNEITDKVGIRFVVLTLDDVRFLRNTVEQISVWDHSLDKDYENERDENPHVFDYQSIHYVVTIKSDIEHQGVKIPRGTCCEVQIRTLMQHAYSELSHGILYKPTRHISKDTTRSLTRSVALIEAVDDYFSAASKGITEELSQIEIVQQHLMSLYKNLVSPENGIDKKTDTFILSIFEDFINDQSLPEITDYFSNHGYVLDSIKAKRNATQLYKQPVILLIYYLIGKKINLFKLRELWPLNEEMIRPIFTDFGDSIDKYAF